MWGHSHGGFTAMRAACRKPPGLKAIAPIMNALDVERDIMHPDGARGDLVRLASWGGMMLLQQLLPPLLHHTSAEERERWHGRLNGTEPFVMELARLGPGDPAWRERVIDASRVTVPTLCVGGWHDIYPDAVWRAYEQIPAPKKLLMGPWGHTLPHASPTGPIDFLPMLLRWWDHWLRGAANGIMAEPPVTLHVRGANPGWRAYPSWPPAGGELTLAADPLGRLRTPPPHPHAPDEAIARYDPDPTTGTAGGLAGVGFGSFAPPGDQADDDARSLTFTSGDLPADLSVVGRPSVVVRLDEAPSTTSGRRVVVRLTDVDQEGRSVLITSGTASPGDGERTVRAVLWPTAYRIAAGHRVRVALGDSDFPRLTPLTEPVPFHVTGLEVTVPTTAGEAGRPADIPAIGLPAPRPDERADHWTVTRDPLHDAVDVTVTTSTGGIPTSQGHLLERTAEIRASVARTSPASAHTSGTHRARLRLGDGRDVAVTASVRCARTTLWVHGEVTVDGHPVFTRTWETSLDPAAGARPDTAPPTARSTTAPDHRRTA